MSTNKSVTVPITVHPQYETRVYLKPKEYTVANAMINMPGQIISIFALNLHGLQYFLLYLAIWRQCCGDMIVEETFMSFCPQCGVLTNDEEFLRMPIQCTTDSWWHNVYFWP